MLSTACPPLDTLLDGGLEEDAITLVFGEGGSGKTNLALQSAREVVAAGAKVAYIDTEGVSARRMEQVFSGLFPDPDERATAISRILFFRPFTIGEQERMVEKTALLQGLGLIVVDSINMHYRLHIDEESKEKEAGRSLYKQLHHLTGYARQHEVPVLVTGQVYGGEDATQPFARRVMEHLVKALVRFEKRPDGSRRATILKHRSIEDGRQARFRIGSAGLEPSAHAGRAAHLQGTDATRGPVAAPPTSAAGSEGPEKDIAPTSAAGSEGPEKDIAPTSAAGSEGPEKDIAHTAGTPTEARSSAEGRAGPASSPDDGSG